MKEFIHFKDSIFDIYKTKFKNYEDDLIAQIENI